MSKGEMRFALVRLKKRLKGERYRMRNIKGREKFEESCSEKRCENEA